MEELRTDLRRENAELKAIIKELERRLSARQEVKNDEEVLYL